MALSRGYIVSMTMLGSSTNEKLCKKFIMKMRKAMTLMNVLKVSVIEKKLFG